MVCAERRTNPRIKATNTAIPVAADTKFCTVKPEHLRQIAQRRLAAVALPVGVGGEADGRVHRQIGRHGGHALRIQRQQMLHPLQNLDRQKPSRLNTSIALA